jgi:hypothetical protein
MFDLVNTLATLVASHAPAGLEASAFILAVGLCLTSPVFVLAGVAKLLPP